MEFLQYLLPGQNQLHLENWSLDGSTRQLDLTVSATQITAPCPLCQTPSRKVHSRYERTLRDIACVEFSLTLLLQVRKFFCTNTTCHRRIFTERLPQITQPWARRTSRLAYQLLMIGLALGGRAGVRLSHHLGQKLSRNTLLNLLAKQSIPSVATVKTLGVDDFAFRKGQRYGTILVDLDKHRPVAMLPDREAATLAGWLEQHPEIQVLSRDRSRAYKQGMSEGAPQAIQVADRFHLLQNLTQVLERFLATQSNVLKAIDLAHYHALGKTQDPPSKPLTAQAQKAQQRRQQRLFNYEQVHKLRQHGFQVKDIAHHLGMGERTVFTYLASPEFPEWKPSPQRRSKPTILTPYKGYLLERWNAGQRQSKQLFQEIAQQGYTGTYKTVATYIHHLRQNQRQQLDNLEGRGPMPATRDAGQRPLTACRAVWLLLKGAKPQSTEDEALVLKLQQHPDLVVAIQLAQQFADLVRHRQPEQLDPWLERASSSSIKQFQNFAKSLQEDYEAVKAGVTLEVSNGQVEGQVNRLKMIKRQMYGRAGLALLSRRFLLAG